MVRGLDIFRSYFEGFSRNYVVIGGTACDIIISSSGFKHRATKDIDIILVVEALDSEFTRQLWNFVNAYHLYKQGDGSFGNICCLAFDRAKKLLNNKKK